VSQIDNEFFPLKPGTTFFYEGTTDGIPSTDEFFVTHETKLVKGVTTTVVRDRAFEDGVLVEETLDWFAQDSQGNVWYFGEDAKELDSSGNVTSTEGSWEAGVDGAEEGIIMEADPKVGDRYQEESAPGVAEDRAEVLSRTDSGCVSFGCFDGILRTKNDSPLEPDVIEEKLYAPGVGFIQGDTVQGGSEHSELVKITTGG
jgi:hypothetical protein